MTVLAEAAVAEVRLDLDRAQELLDEVDELEDEWQRVAQLLRLRLQLRLSQGDRQILSDLKESTKQLIDTLSDSEMQLALVRCFCWRESMCKRIVRAKPLR